MFEFNWVDIIIIAAFVLYGIEGISAGFISSFFDLLSFVFSFIFGLKFYSLVAILLVENASISRGLANAIGFFLIAFISEILLSIILRQVFYPLLKTIKIDNNYLQKINGFFGLVLSFISAYILVAFLLSLVASFPLTPFLKKAMSSSKIGNPVLSSASGFESRLNEVFGGAVKDTLSFLTIEPKSDQSISLNFKTKDFKIDPLSERKMLDLVNKERERRGLNRLAMNDSLREVAEEYAKDMLARGYFSHYTPEGLSPFDRMGVANIFFTYAGENLALSPNVDLAMQGLMNSEGHRANILSAQFNKVGIGVVDAGMYGEMFVQEFTD